MAVGEMPEASGETQGGASQLVADIQDKMAQLSDMLGKSSAIAPEDKEAFQGIMSAYDQFVTQNLGSAPGASPAPKETPAPGPTGMEAGARKVMPAY